MRALKMVGLVLLVLWMAFITWRLEYSIWATERACSMFEIAAFELKPELFRSTEMLKSPNFYCPGEIREPYTSLDQKKP